MREGRPSPFYEGTRIPVPPRKRDCVGELCPFSGGIDCRVSRHHLFFEHLAYLSLGDPYSSLVKDPHAIVSMRRCRHNSTYENAWHNLYSYTELPSEEVAARFVDESRVLQRLGVLIKDMSKSINGIFVEDPASRWRVFGESTYRQKLEFFEETLGEYSGAVASVGSIEVMPSTIVGSVVTTLGERRNELRVMAGEVPELARMQIARLPRVA